MTSESPDCPFLTSLTLGGAFLLLEWRIGRPFRGWRTSFSFLDLGSLFFFLFLEGPWLFCQAHPYIKCPDPQDVSRFTHPRPRLPCPPRVAPRLRLPGILVRSPALVLRKTCHMVPGGPRSNDYGSRNTLLRTPTSSFNSELAHY